MFIFALSATLVGSMWGSYKTNVVYAVGNCDAVVYVYCKQYSGINIASGAGYVKTTYANYAKCIQKARGVDGVTVVVDKNALDVGALVDKLQLCQTFVHQTQDFCCIYGYTPKIRNYVMVDGQKVNVQIAVTATQVHVGSPLILGSY